MRAEAESDRIQAESDRASAETARAEAEEDRADAETLRISAEQERATAQAKNNADQQANNASAQGLVAVILTSGEYDPDTLEPTVEGDVGKMYLVPMPQAQAVAAAIPVRFSLQSQDDGTYVATQAAAADGDTYVEWLWIAGAWERIGLSTATIDPITTDQIDAVCSDGAPQGKQVLNLTGLSYLWAKVKAWATGAFAALSHTHPASQVTGLTASRALVSDSSGHPAASAVTATELGYLDGVKSGVQGQIDALGDSLSHISNGWNTQDFSSRDFNDINSHIGAVYTRDTWSEAQHGPVGADSYGYLFSLVMGTSSLQIFLSQTNSTTNLAMMRSRYSGNANWAAWRAV